MCFCVVIVRCAVSGFLWVSVVMVSKVFKVGGVFGVCVCVCLRVSGFGLLKVWDFLAVLLRLWRCLGLPSLLQTQK